MRDDTPQLVTYYHSCCVSDADAAGAPAALLYFFLFCLLSVSETFFDSLSFVTAG